jgi:membrane protein implicated in regulation of membrane protease activity
VEKSDSRKTLRKYLVLQIPGAVLVAILLTGFHYSGFITALMAFALFAGWCIKDAVMYRFVRSAYEPGPPHGTEALVGKVGTVEKHLAPTGTVRIGAEHWSARAEPATEEICCGASVRVVSVDGYIVSVTRSSDD